MFLKHLFNKKKFNLFEKQSYSKNDVEMLSNFCKNRILTKDCSRLHKEYQLYIIQNIKFKTLIITLINYDVIRAHTGTVSVMSNIPSCNTDAA